MSAGSSLLTLVMSPTLTYTLTAMMKSCLLVPLHPPALFRAKTTHQSVSWTLRALYRAHLRVVLKVPALFRAYLRLLPSVLQVQLASRAHSPVLLVARFISPLPLLVLFTALISTLLPSLLCHFHLQSS